MRVLIQRVSRARVTVRGEVVSEIGQGLLLLVGVTQTDSARECDRLSEKVANLRIFDDANGQMNHSALDLLAVPGAGPDVLVVSQFTLYADTRRGRRPSYIAAAPPGVAEPLIDRFTSALRTLGLPVATGRFGAEMAVELVNDGPVTIWLDTAV